ncbi:hypothetical protein AMJ49_01225 [Parcubacteria bacterium DG_74_2]|nr:MAG: hypothetical protein AMJ49_01225 [Parcubacteria bacterium DG_74_2]
MKKITKESFNKDLYKNTGINELILLAIYSVVSNGKKCTFERLVKECFDLFPKTFSFSKYSKWPDSRKLDRPLRTLRKRKLIKGDPKTSFSLTKAGQKIAIETAKNFRQRKLFK